MEDARTEEEQDDCAGDLEDGFFLAEQDKARGLSLLDNAIERLRLARNPCKFYQLQCKRKEHKLNEPH